MLPEHTIQHVAGAEEEGQVGDEGQSAGYAAYSRTASFVNHHIAIIVYSGAYVR